MSKSQQIADVVSGARAARALADAPADPPTRPLTPEVRAAIVLRDAMPDVEDAIAAVDDYRTSALMGDGLADATTIRELHRLLDVLADAPATSHTYDLASRYARACGAPMWEVRRGHVLGLLSILHGWDYVTRTKDDRSGNYRWTRTDKPAADLDTCAAATRRRILTARYDAAAKAEVTR